MTNNRDFTLNKSKTLTTACLLLSCITSNGCVPASTHAEQVRSDQGDKFTVGKVQREVKIGMTSSEIVELLGSPNIVTTDANRHEQWVYDKVATECVYSKSSAGVAALLLNSVGAGFGLNGASGAHSTKQRTLTVIIKFDANAKVRDFAYHNSTF